ncbi:Leucine--tRNA ligase, mitochondrial [Lachnellula occidentalis]|uniref:leucine--tRNA ligase n=1 Tax=Lachnellula occidentalis TaxID=215460 RepID=A0A8H8UHX9_9HELO|nr:Leucine--tRNA ligase, mitochondrial [Lachnellula occidentalis]
MLSNSRYAGQRLVRPSCSTFANRNSSPNAPTNTHSYSPRRFMFQLTRRKALRGWRRVDLKLNREAPLVDDIEQQTKADVELAEEINELLKPKPKPQNLDLPKIDKKWQALWARNASNQPSYFGIRGVDAKSRDLHLGHLRVYTISDVLARFKHMQGYKVMHPIGWDAFGLPAENAANERGIDPAVWTKSNIEKMKGQLEAMNGHWDWDREVATCDPSFYKHTQRLFLLLHERGLAYQAESFVNYDPVDKTVLANEQVDADGNSWRSGAKVEKRLLKQWFFKISEFRQELLDDLQYLAKDSAWPERVLAMQKNWIGKSTGANIKFPVVENEQQSHTNIKVFTTRPDTLFGVQYLALASTHPIVQRLAKSDVGLQAFLDTLPALPPDSKVGYLLPHIRATNPLSDETTTPYATKASLPIFVAPYVLGDYGDGAVMGVPGHDTRDYAFWKHNRYDEPIRLVIASSPDDHSPVKVNNQPFIPQGHLNSHSGPYSGHTSAQATKKIVALLESKALGSAAETWRLRDWLVSRQRYWGTPIPIIHCESCGPVPVPEDQLPVQLPKVEDHWADGKIGNPLEKTHDWVNTSCPRCGHAAKRDTDTMDTFVDSSWYFMRFPDAKNNDALFSPEAANASLPVDIYIGGVEHAILHLLYARFISKFLATTPYWPVGPTHHGEPFKKVLAQGMVHGKTFSDPSTGRFLKPNEVDLSTPSKPLVFSTGKPPNISYEKMSKSKYNGVDPGTCMSKYGADATRAHILFQAPVTEVLEWDEERISGITRWLRRLYEHADKFAAAWAYVGWAASDMFDPKLFFLAAHKQKLDASKLIDDLNSVPGRKRNFLIWQRESQDQEMDQNQKLWRTVQKTIIDVTNSYDNSYSLNTVVSDLMSLTNAIIESSTPTKELFKPGKDSSVPILNLILHRHAVIQLVKMMAPITPAFAEQVWSKIKPWTPDGSTKPTTIFSEPFPEPDGTYEMLAPATQKCAVQVNGKLRAIVQLAIPDNDVVGKELETFLVKEILATPEAKEKLMGEGKVMADVRQAKKVIVVKGGKTVNFVI